MSVESLGSEPRTKYSGAPTGTIKRVIVAKCRATREWGTQVTRTPRAKLDRSGNSHFSFVFRRVISQCCRSGRGGGDGGGHRQRF